MKHLFASPATIQALTDSLLERQAISTLGIPIIETTSLPIREYVQFRFPKSRKRRVRKKWAKNFANWRMATLADMIMIPTASGLECSLAWPRSTTLVVDPDRYEARWQVKFSYEPATVKIVVD